MIGASTALLAAVLASGSPMMPVSAGNALTLPAQRHIVRIEMGSGRAPVWLLALQQGGREGRGLSMYRSPARREPPRPGRAHCRGPGCGARLLLRVRHAEALAQARRVVPVVALPTQLGHLETGSRRPRLRCPGRQHCLLPGADRQGFPGPAVDPGVPARAGWPLHRGDRRLDEWRRQFPAAAGPRLGAPAWRRPAVECGDEARLHLCHARWLRADAHAHPAGQ